MFIFALFHSNQTDDRHELQALVTREEVLDRETPTPTPTLSSRMILITSFPMAEEGSDVRLSMFLCGSTAYLLSSGFRQVFWSFPLPGIYCAFDACPFLAWSEIFLLSFRGVINLLGTPAINWCWPNGDWVRSNSSFTVLLGELVITGRE